MPDLLLELFSEEIPARMQAEAVGNLSRLLKTYGVFDKEEAIHYVTPRRIAVWIKGLPVAQPDVSEELKGPKVGAPEAALQGFLKKNGLQPDDLVERGGVYFATLHRKGQQTADLIKLAVEKILAEFPWPKSMRWGSGNVTWVRPLHSILCIFDGKVVPIEFGGVTAGNVTCGHRFLAPHAITITNPADYETALEKAYVIADREKRKAEIVKQAQQTASAKGLTLKDDPALLDEVTGLVEWPVALLGSIDAGFMDLPPEVLTTVMRSHQKYFALNPAGREASAQDLLRSRADADASHGISDHFLIISNMQAADGGKAIVAGNERVLRARFSDARFFWDTDRKKPLSEWAEGLKTVTFHARLGTIADKVERIKKLAVVILSEAKNLAPQPEILRSAQDDVLRAAALCKADLVTGMVGEFAELQGIMGRYYALQQNEKPDVADAIRDHYKPQGPNDSVPSNPVSICVALADKLDTLVSMFAIGEKPTGSKDPFALRRAALGMIRIVLENRIRLPLTVILSVAKDPGQIGKDSSASPQNDDLLAFFIDRLIVQLKDSGIRHDVINAVVANGDDDLVRIVARAKALQEFLVTDDGRNLLIAYRRAANIVAIEEKRDNKQYELISDDGGLDPDQYSIALADALRKTIEEIRNAKNKENFSEMMRHAASLRKSIDDFFTNVLVNTDNAEIRILRLSRLKWISEVFGVIANFSLIEG